MDRRHFLRLSGAGAMLVGMPEDAPAVAPPDANWERGQLRHLLPTVSDREILIKASFDAPLTAAPILRIGSLTVPGRMTPIEQHGFTLADFTPDKVTLRMFKWDVETQQPEATDTLEPFHTVELARPA